MALDLTGIDNRGEFYSNHYLDALLEADLKPLLQRWATAEEEATPPVRAPHKVLNGLAGRYFTARAQVTEGADTTPEAAWRAARTFHADLLAALGYERKPLSVALDDGTSLPLVLEVRRGGQPALWVLETGFPSDPDADPMNQPVLRAQLPEAAPEDARVPELTWRELLDTVVFRREDAPAWVLFLGGSEVVLTHRHKWSRGKALAFDLDDLFARRQPTAFRAMAGLLHADALCPADGTSLHESLDESSHKHAFAVSTDLREGAQEAIELLGNEAVHYLRTVRKKGAFGTSDTAEAVDARALTRECLIWLYRLIFLFYVESRSDELGVAPMKSEAYRRGYSLESLRALETVPLTTPQAQDGTYLDASLRQLFALVNDGHPKDAQLALDAGIDTVAFRIHGLKSRLFDDAETPILAKVRFRNGVLQRVIERLSLSREGKHKERGRISYASLGINQLGAVYEGLLSYTGFFADEDLIEVANANENGKPDARSFFVPARDRELYEEPELVRDPTGARIQHPKGTYLFRLAGRDREKSASYYTPEVLTRCLVKYTLRERIGTDPKDENWVGADQLLTLTVCEPAMGSGAFLNEVVNQLAEAYLQRKQAELGRTIESERYPLELQRVKARIAAQNCYGVDLNPLATELGKVSLWLNVLRAGAPAPFFDARLAVGNSLVGARRAGYRVDLLRKSSKKTGAGWLEVAPDEWREQRPADGVYHFLLPAAGMAAFDGDKVVKGLVPEHVERISAWRKGLNTAWTAGEKERLVRLSEVVDRLWAEHAANRDAALRDCDQATAVWPDPEPPPAARRDEESLAEAWKRHEERNSAGRRLKAVLDAWCAWWFWPVLESELLPTRVEWLDELEALLVGNPRVDLETAEDGAARRALVSREVARRHRFVHWDWQFPEVLGGGGFDIVVGNPPWVKLQWNETGILSDLDPRLDIRRSSAKGAADERRMTLARAEARTAYLQEFEECTGQQAFLTDLHNYSLLAGVQTNLYKAFLVQNWRNLRSTGVGGMFHQAGVFDDPKGRALRAALYPRLRWVALAKNQLSLFDGVHHERPYCFTVWAGTAREAVRFQYIANLYHPRTLDESLLHDGAGEVPGIKTPTGEWDLRGHASRVLQIERRDLELFATIYDEGGTPWLEARLATLHCNEILQTLARFRVPDTMESVRPRWTATRDWHEGDRTDDGTLTREAHDSEDLSSLIVSGPHFYVATPFYKTPNIPCEHNLDYATVDLSILGDRYSPATTYVRACSPAEWKDRLPKWDGSPHCNFVRHVHRRRIAPTGERTLVSAILPPGPTTLGTVFAVPFDDLRLLLRFNAFTSSIVADFFVKTTGKSDADVALTSLLPLGMDHDAPVARVLRLNCLTADFAGIWSQAHRATFALDTWTKTDPRLDDWQSIGREWAWHTPLRSPFGRRQALVELDALAAISLGLAPDDLCLAYRIQFPVLQEYEADTWYDRRGRIVFTANRGLVGVGLERKLFEQIRHAQAGDPLPDWATDALGPYQPPFDRCDREADMREAYAEFVRRGVTPASAT